jgi:flagellar P-ring protein FlgI
MKMARSAAFCIILLLLCGLARAERIETVATVRGVRSLRVTGRGLVVGLNGSGDKGTAAKSALQRMLSKSDFNVSTEDIEGGNVALVLVTAEIPPFTRPGQLTDVRVSALNGATSLENGILALTRLRVTPGGPVYAVASGRLLIGGEGTRNTFPTPMPSVGVCAEVRCSISRLSASGGAM